MTETSGLQVPPCDFMDRDQLRDWGWNNFESWLRLIITGGAGLPFTEGDSVTEHPLHEYFQSAEFLHSSLFEFSATAMGLRSRRASVDGYVELQSLVLDELNESAVQLGLGPWIGDYSEGRGLHGYIGEVVEGLQLAMDSALRQVAERVACGVPVYRLRPGEEPFLLSDDEQPAAYLTGVWLYNPDGNFRRMPGWLEGFAFKETDLIASRIFFKSPYERPADELRVLRKAYRAHIGMADDDEAGSSPEAAATSRLASMVSAVHERYYGANFSLKDRETWPTQVTVTEWLRTTFGLSQREADAVDIVARPDLLRKKA